MTSFCECSLNQTLAQVSLCLSKEFNLFVETKLTYIFFTIKQSYNVFWLDPITTCKYAT